MKVEFKTVAVEKPEGVNVIIGQTHFIKSVEDMYEALVTAAPGIKFGLAFSEASGPCLIRVEGTDGEMERLAVANARALGCGHAFVVVLKNAFPINVLPALKNVQEVCSLFCASANPVQVVVAETEQGRGIMGVIDGSPPREVEGEEDVRRRKKFLRDLGYKR